MKISQLTAGRAVDVLIELTPYIANITADQALLDTLKEKIGKDKSVAEIYVYGAKKASTLVTLLLKQHREDLFGILAVLNETTPAEIEKQNILTVISQVRELAQDEDFVNFLSSLRDGGQSE